MTLLKLKNFKNLNLSALYRAKEKIFPLILSVLNGNQEGSVYTDHQSVNYFVINKFGFADLIQGKECCFFDNDLYTFLINNISNDFKIRWYDIPEKWRLKFNNLLEPNVALVERAQLTRYGWEKIKIELINPYKISNITIDNFNQIEHELKLSLDTRFWHSKHDFLAKSFGSLILDASNRIVAACYACAIEDRIAEIDVLTKEACRQQGLGKLVVSDFINKCISRQLVPHWDCYTNNISSLMLAKALNFKIDHLYTHAIISP